MKFPPSAFAFLPLSRVTIVRCWILLSGVNVCVCGGGGGCGCICMCTTCTCIYAPSVCIIFQLAYIFYSSLSSGYPSKSVHVFLLMSVFYFVGCMCLHYLTFPLLDCIFLKTILEWCFIAYAGWAEDFCMINT